MIFCWLGAMVTNRPRRKSTSKKKIQIKAWYKVLGKGTASIQRLFRDQQLFIAIFWNRA